MRPRFFSFGGTLTTLRPRRAVVGLRTLPGATCSRVAIVSRFPLFRVAQYIISMSCSTVA